MLFNSLFTIGFVKPLQREGMLKLVLSFNSLFVIGFIHKENDTLKFVFAIWSSMRLPHKWGSQLEMYCMYVTYHVGIFWVL
jgi:hypothetical protein